MRKKSHLIYITAILLFIFSIKCFGESGKRVDSWQLDGIFRALSLNDKGISKVAVDRLSSLKVAREDYSEEQLKLLKSLLESDDRFIKERARQCLQLERKEESSLSNREPQASLKEKSIPILIATLAGESFNERYPAALTLMNLGKMDKLESESLEKIAKLAGHSDAAVRHYSALALSGSAPLAPELLYPFINSSLRYPDYREELLFEAIYLSGGSSRIIALLNMLNEAQAEQSDLPLPKALLDESSQYPELEKLLKERSTERERPVRGVYPVILIILATVVVFILRKLRKR